MRTVSTTCLVLLLASLASDPRIDAKEQSRFVTAQMRANALANAETRQWVRQRQERAIAAAAPWVDRSDDELWAMVPGQELPRTIYTNKGVIYQGQEPCCPGCGGEAPAKHGRTWWKFDDARPWKVQCRNCAEIFPKNDFEAFYKSALDEQGMFRRKLGDRSLLLPARSDQAMEMSSSRSTFPQSSIARR